MFSFLQIVVIALIVQLYSDFNLHHNNLLADGSELENEAKMMEGDETDHYIGSDAIITLSSLSDESRMVKEDMVFGILTSAEALETRIDLLRLWWLPGSTGCLYFDETMISGAMRLKLPRGVEVCFTPEAYLNRPW
jgi:hypothetical protein